MRIFSLALFLCSLLTTASAVRDYNFEIHLVNQNAPNDVCTTAEFDDLASRAIPTILSIMANPKYDLKAKQASDWTKNGSQPTPNRKERQLSCSTCTYCSSSTGGNIYLCQTYCGGCPWLGRMLLRGARELTDAEVSEIKTNSEGAVRGLLNMFTNISPYSANCTNALIGVTIGSTLQIV